MKQLFLEREPSTETETMARLHYHNNGARMELHTVEQEWRPTAPGGEPNNSCVPAGTYALYKHQRSSGQVVLMLVNHGLGVYYHASDRTNNVGRFLIEIHPGNSVMDVIGCIAPGLGRVNQRVVDSRKAMQQIMDYIGDDAAEIVITG